MPKLKTLMIQLLQFLNCQKLYPKHKYIRQNISANIKLLIYKYQDVDQFKTSISNNCTDDSNFDSVINNLYTVFRLKLTTSQYNTTSQKVQVSYRYSYGFYQGGQFILKTYKTQKQITKLEGGAFPIQNNVENVSVDIQSFVNQVNQISQMQITIKMDEIVQEIRIQYPTFTYILAQCNSTYSLLMRLGFLGKIFAQKLMREEIFLFLLQNVFHETYKRIFLKIAKCINQQFDLIQLDNVRFKNDEYLLIENNQSIFISSFHNKSIKSVDNQYITLQKQRINIENNKQLQDEIIEQDQINLNELFDSNNFVKNQNQGQSKYLEQKKYLQSSQNKNYKLKKIIQGGSSNIKVLQKQIQNFRQIMLKYSLY
ncbi:hypothetical protein ABPG74_003839 [Tetrahymena malaccensis]